MTVKKGVISHFKQGKREIPEGKRKSGSLLSAAGSRFAGWKDSVFTAAGCLSGLLRAGWARVATLPETIRKKEQGPGRRVKGLWREKAQGFKALSIKKLLAALLVLTLPIACAHAAHMYQQGFGYILLVDGREIGFIADDDRERVEAYIEEHSSAAALNYQTQVEMNERVEFIRDRRPGDHTAAEEVVDELHQNLSFNIYAYTLLINGVEMAVLASQEDYEALVDIIKSAYADDSGDTTLRYITIHGDLQSVRTLVSPDAVSCVEETAEIILTGFQQRETYVVSRGDSLWTIARRQNISVSQLQDANPQVNGTLIRPGDELYLMVQRPLVSVSMVEEATVIEKIPFETRYVSDSSMYTNQTRILEPGSHGEKEVTYQITRENGLEVSRNILREEILIEPVTQVTARGTVRPPYQGTGRFAWPLPTGVGTLTSPFGWRGGSMHSGIDIAASVGTAIKAADSGVVATSAYRGSYGNLVIINHSSGYSTYYAHNSRNLVSVGQRVTKGQTIALVGSTGNSTGPHVHFEIRRSGTALNPMRFFTR